MSNRQSGAKQNALKQAINREQFFRELEAHASQSDLHLQVASDGPLNAEIAIVGEGPGETEVRKGLPFVGGSGAFLWDTLRGFGINRTNVYATNVVKRQISLSRKGNEKNIVHRAELERWSALTNWELSQLPNLRIVFALGNYALECLTNQVGITNWRGSVLEYKLPNNRLGFVVATINPAYAMRELKFEPIFKMDAHKLDMVKRGVFKPYKIEERINPSYKEAMDFIREVRTGSEVPSFDIESINGETACIGLSIDPHSAMCINWRDGSRNRYTTQQEADILLAIQELCDSHKVIAQNGQFDAYWCRLKDWLCVNIGTDTLLQHHTLYPQLPHNLGFLTAQYTTHPFYKDEGKSWREGGDIDQFWRYNCKDAAITKYIASRMDKELKQQGLYDFFYNHVMRATPHLISATVHGVAIDPEHKHRVAQQSAAEVEASKEEIYKLIHELTDDPDYRPNLASPKQMQELYFKRLKLRARGFSTDENNRKHMLKEPSNSPLAKELIVKINKYAEDAKFLGTYANARAGDDNRMRCEYRQYGVARAPGRLSSAGLLMGQGQNLQNQPERAKEAFVADPNCVFGYFDLGQAEARVVAWRARIDKWKQQFEQARIDGKYDCHRALASEMFKVPYDDVPLKDWDSDNRPTIRYTAKRCRHGLNYRMEKFRLSEVTGLPYHEAARAFSLYHSITPELEEWWRQAEKDFRQRREVFNPFGRRHKVIQRIDDDVLKSIVAFYPQSTVGDKITRVWYQSEEDDRWPNDARICLDVHDSLICLASPKTIKTALSIMKKYAEEPTMITDAWYKSTEPLIIPADCKMSYNVKWKRNEKGQFEFQPDDKGDHRWGFLKAVDIKAAA